VVFGFVIASHGRFLLLTSCLAFLTLLFSLRLTASPIGRVLQAIREDEILAQSLGKNVTHYKIMVFVVGASLAAMAGGLYASYVTFIDPTSLTIMESVLMLTMVIVGGAGNMWGAPVGAALLVLIPEVLRFLGLPQALAANIRQILYGGLLIIFMLLRPQGIMGKYAFTRK
jgi:branched-chain amino acid transport system permease protein